MIRKRLGRIAALSATAALLATALLGGAVNAANARDVFFGSIGADGGGLQADGTIAIGDLTNDEAVTVGRKAKTTLRIENQDGQTLNHVRIAGGTAANDTELDYNPLYPPPTPTSLPAGASFAIFIRTAGSPATCTPPTGAGASVACDLGSLAPGAWVEFLVVVNVPAVAATYPYWVTASWNEGWSSTGANADYQFALGSLDVKAGCDNGSSSWFLGGEAIDLDEGGVPCNVAGSPATQQEASVVSRGSLGPGFGGFATMEIEGGFTVTCPDGYRCLGHTISATILGGDTAPGGILWTGTWYGTKSIAAVFHFLTGYDPADDSTFDIIPLSKKFKCVTATDTNCWESVTTSKTGPKWVEVIWRTDSNGKGGGAY